MYDLLKVSLIAFLSGVVGTLIGGALGIFFTYFFDIFKSKKANTVKKIVKSSLIEFTSGLMIAVICFDLLPESFIIGGLRRSLSGIVLGVFAMIIVQGIIFSFSAKRRKAYNKTLAAGLLFVIGIALHNLPEGIAIGSSFLINQRLAFSITFAVALHNIPESLLGTVLLKTGGEGFIFAILSIIIIEIPLGAGAFIGAVIGKISNNIISFCLSFAAGAMLYVCVGDLLRESKEIYNGRIPSVFNIFGIVSGIIISFL